MTAATSALGLIRRHRHRRVARPVLCRTCPACGLPIRDRVAARLGFCDGCRDFTGMCGAGRKIVCPDMMSITTWHSPCTRLGTQAWEITLAEGPRRALLCPSHGEQLRSGVMPWIELAIPVRR